MNRNDVFVSLPTGFGKTFCYSVLPVLFDLIRGHSSPTCLIVVVSPLLALMQDQVNVMESQGLAAAHLCHSTNQELHHDVSCGKFQVVFLTPERFIKSSNTREMLSSRVYQNNLVALIVDEAHCIQKW